MYIALSILEERTQTGDWWDTTTTPLFLSKLNKKAIPITRSGPAGGWKVGVVFKIFMLMHIFEMRILLIAYRGKIPVFCWFILGITSFHVFSSKMKRNGHIRYTDAVIIKAPYLISLPLLSVSQTVLRWNLFVIISSLRNFAPKSPDLTQNTGHHLRCVELAQKAAQPLPSFQLLQ